jgi:hypothetical protein
MNISKYSVTHLQYTLFKLHVTNKYDYCTIVVSPLLVGKVRWMSVMCLPSQAKFSRFPRRIQAQLACNKLR